MNKSPFRCSLSSIRSWKLPQPKSDFSLLIGELVRGRWPAGQKGVLVVISESRGPGRMRGLEVEKESKFSSSWESLGIFCRHSSPSRAVELSQKSRT